MKSRILGFVSILILILVGAVSQAQEPKDRIIDGLISASFAHVESVEVYPGGYLVVKDRQGYDGEAATAAFNLRFGLSQEQIGEPLQELTDTDLENTAIVFDGTNLVTTMPIFDHDKWCKEMHDFVANLPSSQ